MLFTSKKIPFIAQHDAMDCGPACLAMISAYFGKKHSLQYLREHSFLNRDGVSLNGLTNACTVIGLESMAIRTDLDTLVTEKPFPCILFWNSVHYVVLYDTAKNPLTGTTVFKIADPASGLLKLDEKEFLNCWNQGNRSKGIAFLVNTTDAFHQIKPARFKRYNFRYLFSYLLPFRRELLYIIAGLLLGSLITLVLPFLTQILIDKGVSNKRLNVIELILLAQVFIYLGSVTIEIVRNWLVVYVGARINIRIISDFLRKILQLPLSFFDTKFTGDFYQRINDHSRIEGFLTSQSLTTAFSLLNFLIFFLVLLSYNVIILLVYTGLTTISVLWANYFMKKREYLDYFRFKSSALNQQAINEIINGVTDIKLNRFESYKIGVWEQAQLEVFETNLNMLRLDQLQLTGFEFFNQLKNILVTYIAAREVTSGSITLGGLLSVSYIIGQMNAPISQLITFFRSLQDAKLSMKRLSEVQEQRNEDQETDIEFSKVPETPASPGIAICRLSFQYEGMYSPLVLDNLSLFIREGKTTAIVGASGGGKTTLMKLLLKVYAPSAGQILVNGTDLQQISASSWRNQCGVVLQDGFIFGETIERNIATCEEVIDREKFRRAVHIANIEDFIEALPQKEKTVIGSMGKGISGGQQQRILLARAVYKEPRYIFFDEATSALDTENENIIHNRLQQFFRNKTVVIIAHRLSTIRHADQIVVLKDGQIRETGTHPELLAKRGHYFSLIQNQLNLDRL